MTKRTSSLLICTFAILSSIFISCGSDKKTKVEEPKLTFFEYCAQGSVENVEKALNSGTSVNQADTEGFTPLFHALLKNPGIYKESLAKIKSAITNDDDKALYEALDAAPSLEPNYEVLELLISKGASLSATDSDGTSIFVYAALFCSDLLTLDRFLDAGGDARTTLTTKYEQPLLTFVTFTNSNPECVRLIAKASEGATEPNENGTTPVMWACMYSAVPGVIDVLVELGADLNDHGNTSGYAPMDWAVKCNRSDDIVKHLKNAGARSTKQKMATIRNTFEKLDSEKIFIGAASTDSEIDRQLAEANRYRGNPWDLPSAGDLFASLETKEEYDENFEKYKDDELAAFNQNHSTFTYDEIVEMFDTAKTSVITGIRTRYLIMGANTKPETYFDDSGNVRIRFGQKSYALLPNPDYDPFDEEHTEAGSKDYDYYYTDNSGKKHYFNSSFTEYAAQGFLFIYEMETGKVFSDFSMGNE